MKCPHCGYSESKVVDSRHSEDGLSIRRRRECLSCQKRFTTYETVVPYGTRLYIVSSDGRYNYGYAIAADTGGALRSGRVLVDLFYNTERECVNFGRRQVKVYILD